MKSFLAKNKKPIIRWTLLPEETYFEGSVPEGYSLGISPGPGYIVVDVDRHGDIDGFDNVPRRFRDELDNTLHYTTKNNGGHFWFKYSGSGYLGNKTSKLGIDLRTDKGYVVWYIDGDIRDRMDDIKETSAELNAWLEGLFGFSN